MPPRFSIWMVLAGVMAGVIAGYLAGSGIFEKSLGAKGKGPDLRDVREEFSKVVNQERRAESLRAFDAAVQRASAK